MDNDSPKKRLTEFVKSTGLGQSAFEKKVGMSVGSISNMTENSSITSKVLNKIQTQYPLVNTTWLLTGNGEMIDKPIQTEDSAAKIIDMLLEVEAKINVLFSNEAEKTAKSNQKKATDVLREMNIAAQTEKQILMDRLRNKS